jgi:D-alanine-D-alanine ligase
MSLNIAIITWWNNNEREISLKSAHAVKQWLESLWYDTVWRYDFPNDITNFIIDNNANTIDFVFLMIHWSWWEDWQIAWFLDLLWIKYQCTHPAVLALTINKRHTKLVRRAHGIPVADDMLIFPILSHEEEIIKEINDRFWFPCVLKELDQWSSNGVFILHQENDLQILLKQYKHYNNPLLIEEYIVWDEISLPIIGWISWPQLLPLIHIIPPQEWGFNYTNKYNWKTQEICPQTILDETRVSEAEMLALEAYNAVWCTKYARIDAILTHTWPIFLEINTIPGFTEQSLFPKSAQVSWYSFSQLLEHLLTLSLS